LKEYLRGINILTIDPANRLQKEVNQLQEKIKGRAIARHNSAVACCKRAGDGRNEEAADYDGRAKEESNGGVDLDYCSGNQGIHGRWGSVDNPFATGSKLLLLWPD